MILIEIIDGSLVILKDGYKIIMTLGSDPKIVLIPIYECSHTTDVSILVSNGDIDMTKYVFEILKNELKKKYKGGYISIPIIIDIYKVKNS